MKIAPERQDEADVLAALRRLEVLDSEPEAEFDALVKAASALCGTPISVISLVDTDRQWFKANIGLPGVSETSRDVAFCAHAVLGDDLFEVPDATRDERFADNPLVTGKPDIRFYAGAPVKLTSGERIGTLCVIDRQPRMLDETQRTVLRCLAEAAARAFEGRLAVRYSKQATRDAARAAVVLNHSADAIIGVDQDGRIQHWNDAAQRLLGHDKSAMLGQSLDHALHHLDTVDRPQHLRDMISGGVACTYESTMSSKDGAELSVAVTLVPERDLDADALTGATLFVRDMSDRVRLGRQLEASERRMRQVYESTPAMLLSIDQQDKLQFVSDLWLKKMGFRRDEVLGRKVSEFLHLPPQTLMTQGSQEELPCQVITRTGEVLDVLLSVVVERNQAGEVERSLLVMQDITLRLRAEQALSSERERLANLIEATQVGTWEHSPSTNESQTNETYASMLGYTRDDFLVQTLEAMKQIIHPDDVDEVERAWREHYLGKSPYFEAEFRLRHKDGHWLWIMSRGKAVQRDKAGKPMKLAGIHMNVSALRGIREALEESQRQITAANAILEDHSLQLAMLNDELRRSEQILNSVLETLPYGVVVYDDQRQLVLHNEMFRVILGYPPDFLQVGKTNFRDVVRLNVERGDFGNERYEDVLGRLLGMMASGETVCMERLQADGRWIEYRGTSLPGDWKLVTYSDISQHKRNEVVLEEARQAAEAASMAKSAFLANMSHEIRTPMNAVLGMLRLLQKTELTLRQQDYVTKSQGAAKALLGLLNDILDFSKVEAGKLTLDPHAFSVEELLRDLSVILSANVGNKDIEVLFDVDPSLPDVLVADATRLRQVLINLAGNAIKFTSHGEVVLRLAGGRTCQEGLRLAVSVTDTGIGIAKDHQAAIFSGFTQAEASTTRRFGGTGLGLAISQRLVSAMGGALELESEQGKGSCFHFEIDVGVAGASADAEQSQVPAQVLIVDDNEVACRLLAQAASANGWQVQVRQSAEDALICLRDAHQHGPRFDAIFVDWLMPGMDGWQAVERMRQEGITGGAKVLLTVSEIGLSQSSRRSEIDRAGIHALLVKPLTSHMMRQAVLEQVKPQARHAEHGQRQGHAPMLKNMRILLVEDNPNNQQVAQELLEDEGAAVTLADHGQHAVDTLRRSPDAFDVVLMDIQMPVMDGYSATRLIRSDLNLTDLPIIAMTANAMRSDREECLEAGMNEHVGKPFEVTELADVLLRWTGRPALSPSGKMLATLNVPADIQADSIRQGFDAQEAMDRFLGKTEMFERLSRSFRDNAVALPADLKQAMQDGDVKAAIMRLHTFKGLAATLCANELAALAARGEARLKGEQPLDSDWLDTFRQLVLSSAPALYRLAQRLSKLNEPSTSTPVDTPQPDLQALASELRALAENLKRADMAATDAIISIRQRHGHCAAVQLGPLDDAIMNLDFENALKLCEQHLQHLQAVRA